MRQARFVPSAGLRIASLSQFLFNLRKASNMTRQT
jgi:hypothetical protein